MQSSISNTLFFVFQDFFTICVCLRGVCAHLEQHIGEVAVSELEVPLVVELEQRRAVRMLLL